MYSLVGIEYTIIVLLIDEERKALKRQIFEISCKRLFGGCIGLFCGCIGLFGTCMGLFCGCLGLFCGRIGPFCGCTGLAHLLPTCSGIALGSFVAVLDFLRMFGALCGCMGLFCKFIGLFCGCTGLFYGFVGLAGELLIHRGVIQGSFVVI